eukprot:g10775.t1
MGKKFSRQKKDGGAAGKGNAYETPEESTSKQTLATSSGGANEMDSTIDMECHHSDAINCLGISSKQTDRLEVYTCSDDKTAVLHQWIRNDNTNTETKGNMSVVAKWHGHKRAVNKVMQGVNGTFFTCSRDLTIKQWKKDCETAVSTLEGHTLTISALAEKTDGSALASGSRDTTVRVWDPAASKEVVKSTTSRNLVTCLQWLPSNSSILAQGSEDLKLRLWDVRSGIMKASQTYSGYVYFPLCMDISRDGHLLMTGSKGFNSVGCEIRIWDLRMNKQMLELRGHDQDVKECFFLRFGDGKTRIISGSKDKTIRVWDINKYNAENDYVTNSSSCLLTEYYMYGDGAFTCMAVADSKDSAIDSVDIMYSIADMDGKPNIYATKLTSKC